MMTALHAAIIASLKSTFSSVPTCEAYPRLVKKISSPAILTEIVDLTPTTDLGTEQLEVAARFRAYIVFDLTDLAAEMDTVNMAAAVAAAIKKASRFGCEVGPAKVLSVEPADFKPDLLGFSSWVVEWTHEVCFGDSVWSGTGSPVTEIMVGWSPDIGIGHEPDYEQVQP